MCNKEDGLASFSDKVQQTSFEQLTSHVHVDGGQWIVHQVYVTITVHRSGYADSLFLTATQVDTSLTDLPQDTTYSPLIPCTNPLSVTEQSEPYNVRL